MSTYYNDIDGKACAWVEELIRAGLVPGGKVDCRPIQEVTPDDIKGFDQCHFFCGIAGWAYALELAGWPRDRPVWSASLPCQPFSAAGKGLAERDERHLWPAFRRLVAFCQPPTVFGEQVASGAGRQWLAGVRADLEAMGYAVGAADLCAASLGAPHIRQRLFWVADTEHDRHRCRPKPNAGRLLAVSGAGPRNSGGAGGLADTELRGRGPAQPQDMEDTQGRPMPQPATSGLGDAARFRQPGGGVNADSECAERGGNISATGASPRSFWADSDLVPCRDGKARRVEPGTFPLAHGIPGRVGLLRGYGNAIVPQVAAAFIQAYQEKDLTTEPDSG